MNNTRYFFNSALSLGLLTLFTLSLQAQPADRREGRFKPDRGGERADRMRGGLERWLEEMKARDPEDFERMSTLRRENPREFMAVMRKRLMEKRLKTLDRFPGVAEAVNSLPEDQRRKFQSLFTPMSIGDRIQEGGPDRVQRNDDPKIREIRERYAGITDLAQRNKLREELKQHLRGVHESRMQHREDQIRKIEQQLNQLRASMAEHRKSRDSYLDRHLDEILGGKKK